MCETMLITGYYLGLVVPSDPADPNFTIVVPSALFGPPNPKIPVESVGGSCPQVIVTCTFGPFFLFTLPRTAAA